MGLNAVIVGAGEGISAAFARALAKDGAKIALAARDAGKLADLAKQTAAIAIACDASQPADVAALFQRVDRDIGPPDVVLFNASARARGPLVDLDPSDVANALAVGAFGGFLVAQEAARRMLPRAAGAIFSPAPRPASRAMPNLRPSRWPSLRCAVWPKPWHENSRPRVFTLPILLSTAACAPPSGAVAIRPIACSTPTPLRRPI